MKIRLLLASAAALTAVSVATPAMAEEGKIQIKAFVTGVLPDGEITDVNTDIVGLPAGSQSRATDSVVPTIAAEYFLSPNFSLETICCITPHDVRGSGALEGTDLVDDLIILPATVTAKYHFKLSDKIKPYIGAGPTYFFIFGEDVGADAAALGATDVDLSDELGFVLQTGVDVKLNDRGLGLSLDAKRYFIGTTATFRAGNAVALQTEHDLDPWVVSAGLTYRF
ncbi:OmpW family protein [Sphingorhabdus arenilitoris]|uniref:OmpW family protein n=1 Tax=Sphingorhabdus arenilitoris TaxID=1490041 RepID=A0ABV8RFI6_9SPHN